MKNKVSLCTRNNDCMNFEGPNADTLGKVVIGFTFLIGAALLVKALR